MSTAVNVDQKQVNWQPQPSSSQPAQPQQSSGAAMFEHFNIKRFLMEFVGSFGIVYFGNWAQIFRDLGQSNFVAVALTVGIVYTIFTWIGSHISGAHFNPVTTLSMIFLKKIGWSTGIIYWVFQLLGGMIAGAMIYLQVPPEMFKNLKRLNGLGLPTPDKRYTSESVWTELISTFFFQFAVMSLHLDKRAPKDVYAIGTGAMMALGILTTGDVSGGGINPARVFGPSIITGDLGNDIFIFIVGPVFGSLLAAFLYKEIFIEKKKKLGGEDDEEEHENSSSEGEVEDDLATDLIAQEALPEAEVAEEDAEVKSDEEGETKPMDIMANNDLTKEEKLRAIFGKKRPGDDVFDKKD